MNTTGKIALITGGSRGLGRDAALQLADAGHDIIFTYNSNEAAAQKTAADIEAKGRKAAYLQLDTGNISSLEGFAKQVHQRIQDDWGRDNFDFLVNNAGVGAYTPIGQTEEEAFDRLMNIQFKGVCSGSRVLTPV